MPLNNKTIANYFTLRIKEQLQKENLTITDIARETELDRPVVSMMINLTRVTGFPISVVMGVLIAARFSLEEAQDLYKIYLNMRFDRRIQSYREKIKDLQKRKKTFLNQAENV